MTGEAPSPEWLAAITGASTVGAPQALSGGASRDTFGFTADERSLVLQRQRPASGRSLVGEAALLDAARTAGVPVPVVVTAGTDDAGLEYLVTGHVEGETIARRILRDARFAAAREALTAQLGTALAALAGVPASAAAVPSEPDQLDAYRRHVDDLDVANPVFELAFVWLGAHRPAPPERLAVVHGDFRLGNLVVDDHGLAAVLDWELAHLGDPLEDLGWLCAPAWRFGSARPVAGVGDEAQLLRAYEEASGSTVDRNAVTWWRVLASLKWGVMCVLQARTHLDGVVRSHELAAIGRRVAQTEHDLLTELEAVG